MNTLIAQRDLSFLQARGEMGQLTRNLNWAETSLGSPGNWPQSLCTAVGIVLQSKFPMFLFWGPDLICFYNDAFRPSLGNDGKHPWALGKPGEVVWSEIWTVIKPWLDQVLTGGEAIWMENQLVGFYRNGQMEDIYWTFSYSPIPDESGKPGGVLVTCTETTDMVLNLHRIEESNDELLFAIEATELGTWDVDTIKGSLRSNKRLKEWFGLDDKQEVALSTAIEVIAEKDRQRVKDAIAKALQFETGGGYEIEYTIIHPVTKKERHVKAKGRAWFNDQKVAYRFNGTLQDITVQVIASNEIRETEKKFRNTVNQVPVGITILRGPEFVVEMANETYLQLVDRKEAEFIGKPLFETLPEVKESVECLLNNVRETGTPFYGSEFPVTINRHGKLETTYFNFAYTPLHENDGQVNGIAVVANEVTSLVEAKHALAESEKQFRSMVTQSPISMAIFRGQDMVIEIANKVMFEHIWRKKENDVLGKPLLEVFRKWNLNVF